ncbi:hypothetical protein SAMN05216386_0236 [Nitrosospira briensis]|uniref:Uncharacterized protein n=1 Tax=Nitrosospira briensis TaxID=35799 RepID=A0A1I4XPU8_9PROT|nr:hypothetical protein SAMN05216386_0236 [Nitrosospira briensis]SFO01607.1 hypothetical protein SAMN05216332_103210 [Nitrosospira briensis]
MVSGYLFKNDFKVTILWLVTMVLLLPSRTRKLSFNQASTKAARKQALRN